MIRFTILIALISTPATAQSPCGDRAAILSHLATKYGETAASAAITSTGSLFEITANPKAGTWTALDTVGSVTCIILSGGGWRAIPQGVDA